MTAKKSAKIREEFQKCSWGGGDFSVVPIFTYLNFQVLVVPGGEELVDKEWPGHEDEEERVPELGVRIHLVKAVK